MIRRAWWLLPLALFLACAGWAVSAPVGSSPDDDFHLTSIWCAAGECSLSQDGSSVSVRADVVGAADCYRFESTVSAACTSANTSQPRTTDRANQVKHLYPSGFYAAMSRFVGPDVERSVLAMRLANAALAALVVAAVLALTPVGVGTATAVAVAATFVPLGLFLTASTNPSAWTVIGVPAFLAFSFAWLREPNPRQPRAVAIAVGVAVTAMLAMGSRVDANAYLVLASALAVILPVDSRPDLRRLRGRLAVLVLIAVAAVVNYLSISSTSLASPGADSSFEGTANAGLGLLLTNFAYLPVLFQGIVGGWQLGWNDTLMPPFIPVIGTLVVGALLYRGLAEAKGRQLAAMGLAAAALVAIPIGFLQLQHLGVGELVQPRYLLPLLTLLVLIAGLPARVDRPMAMPRAAAVTLGAALSISAVLGYWVNALRYAVGSDAPLFDRDLIPEWGPLLGLPFGLVSVVTVLASVVFVGGTFVVAARATPASR